MNLQDYQKLSVRTLAELDLNKPWITPKLLNEIHMVLGIESEMGEIIEVTINKTVFDKIHLEEEFGDFLWFFTNYFTINETVIPFNFNQKDFDLAHGSCFDPSAKSSLLKWDKLISDFTNIYKGVLAYNKPINAEELGNILSMIYLYFCYFVQLWNIDIERVMQNNIDKLKLRYPDKFNVENALSRNLTEERKQLEKGH